MNKIYISGSITNKPDTYKENFEKAEQMLRDKDYRVINPVKLDHKDLTNYAECLKTDIAMLLTCDGIYMLTDFCSSFGATVELVVAEAIGLEIYYQSNDLT